jgi:prophage DNA circulation protein
MADCRDWLSTLWAASYKGVPFWFETDDEEGGRDQVVHKFPHRDVPFVEDMGEAPRFFSGTAYVSGDDLEAQEASLKRVLTLRGAGTLVLPTSGPVTVQCQTFRRHHERDKLGYLAFEVKFVRDGAAHALISVPLAINLAFVAADALAAILADVFAAAVSIEGEVDYVAAAAVDGVSDAAASLDVVRSSYRVEPAASALLRDRIAAIVTDAPDALSPETGSAESAATLAAELVAATRALADALPPDSAVAAMGDLIAAFAPISPDMGLTPTARRAEANAAAAARTMRLAALVAYSEAMLRRSYVARPDGVAARAAVAGVFEAEAADTTGADQAPLYLAIDDLRGKVIDYLSRVINDLAPVVTVSSARSLPSLYLAWRLYQDPLRAAELVARNAVRHPSFMPLTITALAR